MYSLKVDQISNCYTRPTTLAINCIIYPVDRTLDAAVDSFTDLLTSLRLATLHAILCCIGLVPSLLHYTVRWNTYEYREYV